MNNNNKKSYKIPTQTLPGLEISFHINDLKEIISFLENRGIFTNNTRLSRYLEYLEARSNSESIDESQIFKNSTDGPFESSIDWYLYTLREVHELMWILKGLKKHIPKGLDEKLKLVVSGRDFAALDSNSISRNTQFELRIASYYCQTGCKVDLSKSTDIIAINKKYVFFTECKRVGSPKQLENRLSSALKQLNLKMPRRAFGKIVTGCIAADVTKVAFDHNGLTFGMTNEHSRDVIQEKLIKIADSINDTELFDKNNNLNQIWLQIHIPSLIVYPPTSVTRFSSYFIFRDNLDRKGIKAVKTFQRIFESCSKDDKRGEPPKKLKRKKSLTVPKGTTFNIDEDLLNQYLSTGKLPDRNPHDVIAKLDMHGENEEFSFMEFQMLAATIDDQKRKNMSEDIYNSRLNLVLEMYIQRHPYEDIEN